MVRGRTRIRSGWCLAKKSNIRRQIRRVGVNYSLHHDEFHILFVKRVRCIGQQSILVKSFVSYEAGNNAMPHCMPDLTFTRSLFDYFRNNFFQFASRHKAVLSITNSFYSSTDSGNPLKVMRVELSVEG